MSSTPIRVRMAEFAIGKSPDILVTIGLGSCVGVAIYDRYNNIGGLIHIMLPENKKGLKPAKYADTGIPLLIKKMEEEGAKRRNMVAKIAGGSHMFSNGDDNGLNVGSRNIKAVREILAEQNIDIVGEDVGKTYGRTMEFHTEDGKVIIKSYKMGKKIL
ncbi:chemotaxis protein CheD [Halothermothrix orenii]|uniref:Probable chemoreceptor glutamine deamidase CheD n=1 Tax=Halothermothrix orenii (strain H 168 / OCM 544 / DSM 9562) TaxID=373903 RepID=B8CW52_HALOH|nr:chemotaxis protein CheD [Halothermothrix orenii]ACL69521.1 chemotaxis protein CheD [Halothermothrix orenii H 168]